MINPRGDGLDRVLGGAGLPHSGAKHSGFKAAHRSVNLHLPKDNQEVTAHVKRLQVMLDAAIVVDPTLNRDDEAWGHDRDHWKSPHGDSTSSLTPPEERDRRRDWDDPDLRDIIHGRDACGRIENQCQEHERLE
jgi:hypothetical protein